MLGGASAAVLLNAFPKDAESQENRFEFFSSELTPENLRQQREAAVTSLAQGIPPSTELNHLRDHVQNLGAESQMYIPDSDELNGVLRKSTAKLSELAENLGVDSHGIFIFADVDARGNRTQRMYVVKKTSASVVSFVKAYHVSTALNGFGNDNDSEKTPLGLHRVHSGKIGLLGEVVSGLMKNRDTTIQGPDGRPQPVFIRQVLNGIERFFVRGFGRESNNPIVEVITDQYLLHGPQTNTGRGIRIHGTNKSGERTARGWRSFLGGRARSSGCIRMSNTDIRDLHLAGYIKMPDERSKQKTGGSAVMIYATPAAIETAHEPSPEDVTSRPARWKKLSEEELQELERKERRSR